jgi:chromosome segregation ATPase
MNKETRAYIIFLAIAYLLLCYSSVSLFILKENEKDKRISVQKRLDEITAAKSELETKLKEAEAVNAEVRANIKFQEDKIALFTQRLEEERSTNARNGSKLQEKDIQIQNLKVRIEEERAEKSDMLKRLEKLSEDSLAMKVQLEYMMKTKEELEKKAKEMADRQDVSLGTIVISQTASK